MLAKLRAWLVLTRGSNLPTVWSNLFAGWLLGYIYTDRFPWVLALLGSLYGLLFGVSLLYVGGMILNDVFDAAWDTERRSTRPIPAGIVTRRAATVAGVLCLLFGAWFTIGSSLTDHRKITAVLVGLLIACILVYDRWHKNVAWAPVVMGACRALLPLIGFFAVGGLIDGPHFRGHELLKLLAHPLVLWALTLSITVVARHEATPGRPPRWAEWLLYLVPVPLLFTSTRAAVALFACILYWAWLAWSARRNPLPAGVGRRVSDRLASLPLIDLAAAGLFYSQVGFLQNGQDPVQDGWAHVAKGLAWMVPFGAFGLTLILRRWIPQT
jgi:4-hydroxybenzoate polyprenyltransferase